MALVSIRHRKEEVKMVSRAGRHTVLAGLMVLCCVGAVEAHDGQSTPGPQPTENGAIALDQPPRDSWDAACTLTLRLTTSAGNPMAGVVRIVDQSGRRIHLAGLLSRATGLTASSIGPSAFLHLDSWSLVPGEVVVSVPREQLTIEAFQGLNSRLARVDVDLRQRAEARIAVPVVPLSPSFEAD